KVTDCDALGERLARRVIFEYAGRVTRQSKLICRARCDDAEIAACIEKKFLFCSRESNGDQCGARWCRGEIDRSLKLQRAILCGRSRCGGKCYARSEEQIAIRVMAHGRLPKSRNS